MIISKIRLLILFIIMFSFITGCNKEKEIVNISINEYDVKQDIDEFNISDLSLKLSYDDDTYDNINVTRDMISTDDLAKLSQMGKHSIVITYNQMKVEASINLTNYYEVKYVIDNNVIDTQNVEYGMDSVLPNTEKEGYTFLGWDKDGKNITEDTVINGSYNINKYKVIIMIDNKEIDTQEIEYGSDVILPVPDEKDGYTFVGWDNDGKSISNDIVINGSYEINKYKVSFMMGHILVDTQIIEHGKDAITPTNINYDSFVFKGWLDETTGITEDLVINAEFEREIDGVKFKTFENQNLINQIYDGLVVKGSMSKTSYVSYTDYQKIQISKAGNANIYKFKTNNLTYIVGYKYDNLEYNDLLDNNIIWYEFESKDEIIVNLDNAEMKKIFSLNNGYIEKEILSSEIINEQSKYFKVVNAKISDGKLSFNDELICNDFIFWQFKDWTFEGNKEKYNTDYLVYVNQADYLSFCNNYEIIEKNESEYLSLYAGYIQNGEFVNRIESEYELYSIDFKNMFIIDTEVNNTENNLENNTNRKKDVYGLIELNDFVEFHNKGNEYVKVTVYKNGSYHEYYICKGDTLKIEYLYEEFNELNNSLYDTYIYYNLYEYKDIYEETNIYEDLILEVVYTVKNE